MLDLWEQAVFSTVLVSFKKEKREVVLVVSLRQQNLVDYMNYSIVCLDIRFYDIGIVDFY
jgi:hypothetical protein